MHEYIQNSKELSPHLLMPFPPNYAAKQIVPFESRAPTLLKQVTIVVALLFWRMYKEFKYSLIARV